MRDDGRVIEDGALRMRERIERSEHDPLSFRAALLEVPELSRDAWVDRVLGLEEIPEDGDDLPKDGVPYLPASVDSILRVVDHAPVVASDVFVDLGSGIGRALALVHLLTGAHAIGVEIQHRLAEASRDLARRFPALRVTTLEGDAEELVAQLDEGTVFFLYCPFAIARVRRTLARLEPLARNRTLKVCSVDGPLPELPWLPRVHEVGSVAIHRTQ